jgi:hypothetical protein
MGARQRLGKAALCAVLLLAAARSGASTVWEPIARLSLEGGYDTNVLHDGDSSDRMTRVSPELGLRLRDHLWDARLAYGGDWIVYERLAPNGIWNHRGSFLFEATPTRRLELRANVRGGWMFDSIGLAQAGIFRAGRDSAFVLSGTARGEYRLTPRLDAAVTLTERTVRFEDATGGALHQPGLEALWRATPRLSVGGAYALGVFQDFAQGGDGLAFSHGARARARWRATRHLTLEGAAGPALWIGGLGDTAVVPEAAVQVLGASRSWDLRASLSHGLGIGSTAAPGLVDAVEFGVVRRIGRRYVLHGDGGLWRSGRVPSGGDSVTGYAVGGDAGVLVGMNLRLALAATHFARLDNVPELSRTTLGLRLGWELPAR